MRSLSRAHLVVFICILLALLTVLIGCSGGRGNSSDKDSLSANERSVVEGYVYVEAGRTGDITLGYTATPPVGKIALDDARVSIVDGSSETRTNSEGFFRLSRAAPGLRRLRVRASGLTTQEFPLTVLANATIRVGAPTITRAAAAEKVDKALADAGTDMSALQWLGTQQPVPAEVRVSPAILDPADKDDPALVRTLDRDSWFFYVDPQAGARFPHRVVYYYVDIATGAMTSEERDAFPALNGRLYYGDTEFNETSPDTMLAPSVLRSVTVVAPASRGIRFDSGDQPCRERPTTRATPLCDDPKTYAVLVSGDPRPDMTADVVNMATLFEQGRFTGLGPVQISPLTPPSSGSVDVKTRFIEEFRRVAAEARPCDTIFIYVSAHGTQKGNIVLNASPATDGTPVEEVFDYMRLDLDLPITDSQACHIFVVMDFCFSGLTLDRLKNRIEGSSDFTGKQIYLMASASSNEYANGITKSGSQPLGGAFTNSLVASLREKAGDDGTVPLERLSEVFNGAADKTFEATKNRKTDLPGTPVILGQHPQFYERPLAPGEACGSGPSPSPTPTPSPSPTEYPIR